MWLLINRLIKKINSCKTYAKKEKNLFKLNFKYKKNFSKYFVFLTKHLQFNNYDIFISSYIKIYFLNIFLDYIVLFNI